MHGVIGIVNLHSAADAVLTVDGRQTSIQLRRGAQAVQKHTWMLIGKEKGPPLAAHMLFQPRLRL